MDSIVEVVNANQQTINKKGLGFKALSPRHYVAGIIFWGAFNTALELTNTETFCISCHEMRSNVFEELKTTVHYNNRSGVRAHCPDCHVPHEWTHKIARKMQASKEVWGKLFGTINTREKFLDHRLELAIHEWARMKANDSLECRNCHSAQSMDITRQSPRGPPAVSVHGSEDLHRLPQRHCPPFARYAQCSRLAIGPTRGTGVRRCQWLTLLSSHLRNSGVLLPRASAIPSLTRTVPPSA